MDFAFLPPEINSARMYTGPGSGTLLTAAGSWDSLSAELGTTAQTYESVLSSLTGLDWRGPASESMSAAAAPYVAWLCATAEQARQTAMQARAAAAAYQQAYAMTVPPPAITANRTRLMSLIATNLLGQNTAAIAAVEAQYAEMWAQDAAAMTGYAAGSAAAAQLTAFTSPQQTTTPTGLATQSAAVTQANGTAAAATPISQLISVVTQSLQALPAGLTQLPSILPSDFTVLDSIFAVYSTVGVTQDIESIAAGVIGAENNLGILPDLGAVAEAPALAPALTAAPQASGAASGLGGAGLGNVTATLARAGSIGPMSVPASWSAPTSGPVSAWSGNGFTTLPGTDELTGTEAGAGMPGVPGMPAGMVSRAPGATPRYGIRLTVMGRPLAGG